MKVRIVEDIDRNVLFVEKMDILPRKGDQIKHNEDFYEVSSVCFCLRERFIRVLVLPIHFACVLGCLMVSW